MRFPKSYPKPWLIVAAVALAACSDQGQMPSDLDVGQRRALIGDRSFHTKSPGTSSSFDAGGPAIGSTHGAVSFSMLVSGLATQDLNDGITAVNLAQDLVGAGVSISNVTFTGSPVAAGRFTGGASIIGIDAGVILGSGAISNVIGPNDFDDVATQLGTAGDASLAALTGQTSQDAAVLEFDFVPTDDLIFVQYVFASDEYNEYVNSAFDDAFAFFVNGQNCALTPSAQRVSINTINNGNPFGSNPKSHPELYVNNDLSDGGGSFDTEMDGFTTVLTCEAAVIPNVTNHMKLAISDMTDQVYDSHVFLKAGSFSTTPPTNQQPLFLAPTPHEGSTHVVTVGQTLTLQIAAEDPDAGDLVTITATGAPATATLTNVGPANPVAATFTFTPTAAHAGSHAVTFEAGDDDGATTVRHINILVNQPPAFVAPTPPEGEVLTVRAGYPITFDIAADDPDAGQQVSLTHGPLPAGASLSSLGPADPLTVTFSWTPPASAAGPNVLTFSATDPHGAATPTRSVTINVVGVINVTVLNNNIPVPNQIVAAVNNLTGVVRGDGSYSIATTNALGSATIADLGIDADGKYCVYTKPIRSEADATLGGTDLVPPENGYTPQHPSNFAPALTGPDSDPYDNTVAFTRDNYVTHCITAPVIHLTTLDGVANVTLNVEPGPSMRVQWEDLNGNLLQNPGWVVLDADGLIPWFPSNLVGTGVKAGLLTTGAPADASGFVNLTGLTPATPVFVESGIVNVPEQGQLTFTIQTATPDAPTDTRDLGTLTLEPLLCTLNRHMDEVAGDNSAGKIDFIGPIKDGFRATYGVPLMLRNEISIFYSQRGTGDARLQMRFYTPGGTLSFLAEYSWNGVTGGVTRFNGGAADAGVTAQAFFAGQPDGTVRVTWSIASLPAGFTGVTYALHTAGDQFPNPAKQNQTSAFQSIGIPSTCSGRQGNDDQWWVGGL